MATRRAFLASSFLSLWCPSLLCLRSSAQTTRLPLETIDRARILAAAKLALDRPVSLDRDPEGPSFLSMTLDIPALAAATFIDPASTDRYATKAAVILRAWFLAPENHLSASPPFPKLGGFLLFAPLAELAVSLPFMSLAPDLLSALKLWFRDYLRFLTESRTALLARDARNHHASSWLLQVAAFARLVGNEATTGEARHHFKTATVRSQIAATGLFPHDLTSPNPYRDSLLNLDLLAGVCVLLSTRFESIWDFELQDGPGMRAAIARHVPFINDRSIWPYPADQTYFHQLPARRPALLFAARAFAQPEYAALWRTLDPDPVIPEILRAFPIRQPILWLNPPRIAG